MSERPGNHAASPVVTDWRKMDGYSVYADDDGRPVEGHSVKAPS